MPPPARTRGHPHPPRSARSTLVTSSHRAESPSPESSDEEDGEFEVDAPLLDRSASSHSRGARNLIKMQRLNSHSVDDGGSSPADAKKKSNGTSSPSSGLSASLGYDGAKDDAVQGTRTAVRPAAGTGNSDGEDDDPELSMRLDDLFDPSKSAVENKSLLVSAELDRMGMGRYQWFIFFLCGLGFFIDLLWAQALGLIATPVKNEFANVTDSNIGLLSTAFSVGLTVGAFMWGFLVDVVGRRWSFYLTCLISSIFGLAAGGSNDYAALCTLTAFVGLGVGGNIPIDATITLEFLPTNRRFLLAMLSVFQPIGVLVCSGIAYGFIPRFSCALSPNAPEVSVMNAADCPRSENMGWRYMLFTLGGITLFVFFARFLVFTFRESPQYLLARGLDEKAIDVVKQIAKVNKAKPPLFGLQHFDEIDRRLGLQPGLKRKVAAKESARESFMAMIRNFTNARFLFSTPTMARVTIILWLVFIADFWSFSTAGFFLPQILIDKGGAANIPLSETYRNFVAIYAPGIAGCLLAACMVEVPRLGRQWAMVFSSALMAISLFLYTVVDTQAASVGFNAMEYFFQSMFNAILYAFVPEVYPSSVRGTASGLASTWGRLSSILAPIAGQSLYSKNTNGVLYLAGGVMLLCPVALALLPFDTRGRRTF